jgi:hypothetical protein
MSKVPRRVGLLGAIVAFCGAMMAALLCGCPPPVAARRAAMCAGVCGVVAWLCAAVALGVICQAVQVQGDQEGA